jgi:23S rRNA (pseudouridine1915-N3)-methyltransferase
MKISIVAIDKPSSGALEKTMEDYLKRTNWKVNIKLIPPIKDKSSSIVKKREGESLLKHTEKADYIIAMSEEGKNISSHAFAALLNDAQLNSQKEIAFLIGGAYGHSDLVKQKVNKVLSLGKMTLPHLMARLVLVEQIYRAQTILQNHPYHK